jgi:hypothetical protein
MVRDLDITTHMLLNDRLAREKARVYFLLLLVNAMP